MSKCNHENFDASVHVARLEDIGRFSADITITCRDCNTPFVFLGLPIGLNLEGATRSLEGTEARLSIAAKGEPIPEIEGVGGYTVKVKPIKGATQ